MNSRRSAIKVGIKGKYPEKIQGVISRLESALGEIFVREDERSLPAVVVEALKNKNLTICMAESCTGGLASAMLTGVSGSSAVFWGSFITYSNNFKEKLGVDPSILAKHGAVSEQIVRQMTQASMKSSGADISISISGIAGPDGGTEDKPVGTVWIGLKMGDILEEAYEFHFSGNRESVRKKSCIVAFCLVMGILDGKILLDSLKKSKYSKLYSKQYK